MMLIVSLLECGRGFGVLATALTALESAMNLTYERGRAAPRMSPRAKALQTVLLLGRWGLKLPFSLLVAAIENNSRSAKNCVASSNGFLVSG